MSTAKILISLPDELAARLKTTIPPRQRSKVLRTLIEKEITRREKQLYKSALAVETDKQLNKEMEDWDVTAGDGIDDDETW